MDIFDAPLLTARETARHLEIPESTLNYWLAEGREGNALVHSVPPDRRGWPCVPFAGVIEAYVLRSLRTLGLRKSQVRMAADQVREDFGDEWALASQRIATDGVDIFVRYADDDLARAGDRQGAIREVVDGYLSFVTWDRKGWPKRLKLRQYPALAPVVIDPRFAWGAPVLEVDKTPVGAIVDLWRAGEPMDEVAAEYGLTRDAVEQICRVAA